MRRKRLILLWLMLATLCGGLIALGQPVTRYVSSAIGASGDGLAWGTAWKNTTNIVWSQITPGSTIYFDGGASGLNYGTFTNIAVDGTAGNYITIAASTESGRDGIVTFATPNVVTGDYIKFDGNGYKNIGGNTNRCGIVFTCNNRTTLPVDYNGGHAINTAGLTPWFNYCYFNGTYGAGAGHTLGHYGTSGMILTRCWFYQSSWEDQLSWEMTSAGGVFAITNCVFQDNNLPNRTDDDHRDIVNPWTGESGYELYVVGCLHFNTPGHASDQPQGDGFLLQDSYWGSNAPLPHVYFANNASYDCGFLLRFGTANSGSPDVKYFNNTVRVNSQEGDGFSTEEGAYVSQPNTAGTSSFITRTQANLIVETDSGMNFIAETSPLGADGIPFTDDDGLMIQTGSAAINAGSSGAGRPTTDIRGYERVGSPDLGAYEFGASAPEEGPPPVVTALRTVNLYIK